MTAEAGWLVIAGVSSLLPLLQPASSRASAAA
jgi:hypothetical protein